MTTQRKSYRRASRRWSILTLVVVLIVMQLGLMPTGSAANGTNGGIIVEKETILAHGAVHKQLSKKINGSKVVFHIIEVDLGHEYIRVAPMFGSAIGERNTVTDMVKHDNAIAGLNASFFNMNTETNEGGTFGMIVRDGELISNAIRSDAWQTFAILQDQTAIIQQLGFKGNIVAPNGKQFSLEGINKTEYFMNGASNYSGRIHLFDRNWGTHSRGARPGYNELVELEVTNDYVTDMRINGQPQPIPEHGYVLMAHGEGARFLMDNFQLGDPVYVDYQATPENLDITQAIGANFMLVHQGKAVEPPKNELTGRNTRSALGIDRTGKKLIMLAVQRTNTNPGMSLAELSQVFIELGSYQAVNLDGGGSTNMVVREPGYFNTKRVNVEKQSEFERRVADALGIFNIAPKAEAAVITSSGPTRVLAGDDATYTFFGYDRNYHPLTISQATWSSTDPMAHINRNTVTWQTPGQHILTIAKDSVAFSQNVHVLGPDDIVDIQLPINHLILLPNQEYQLQASVKLTDNSTYNLNEKTMQIISDSPNLIVNGTKLQAGSQISKGTLTVQVLGKTKELTYQIGYTFADIQGHWAQENIELLASKGFAQGVKPGQFAPGNSISRADLVVFLSRLLNWQNTPDVDQVTFNEKVPEYAAPALKYAVYHGIMKGDDLGRINASNPITRVEMAALLMRALEQSPNKPAVIDDIVGAEHYLDWEQVPLWGQDVVKYVTDTHLFMGANGHFNPVNNISRAEVATVLVRAFFPDEAK